MSSQYKYQEDFAAGLARQVIEGAGLSVRLTIRSLKNKSQAAYIAAQVASILFTSAGLDVAISFVALLDPNKR